MSSRIRLTVSKDCRYATESLPGKGVQYLKDEPDNIPTRLGVAIGALFGPMKGLNEQEVEALISKARLICEDYWALARSQAFEHSQSPSSETLSDIETEADELWEL